MFRKDSQSSQWLWAVVAANVVVVLGLGAGGWFVWRNSSAHVPQAAAVTTGLIRNGTFDKDTAPWASSRNMTGAIEAGRLCADVPGKTGKPYDVNVTQNGLTLTRGRTYEWTFAASSTPAGRPVRAVVGLGVEPYDTYFEDSPKLDGDAKTYRYTFTAPVDTKQGQVAFQVGGSPQVWRFCVDDVTLTATDAPAAAAYRPDTGPRVRVNQVAYLSRGPKHATVVTDATDPAPWQLRNAEGATVADGRSVPRGVDASSGQRTHTIDFSDVTTRGTGYTLVADGETSHPFDIGGTAYEQLAVDALKFYYPQRSGIEIQDILRPGYARPAAHLGRAPNLGDTEVPCQPKVCDYTLDVRGGWYDAGDHGKYVVNGGISVWQLMNEYERASRVGSTARARLADGRLAVPESDNDVPDILDEARWELEFLLRMQVPKGEAKAGMVHHKVHDEKWTELPLLPNADPQKRLLYPPSTAATLNLAAVAAQAARLFKPFDAAFADRCLAAARTAWAAAQQNPKVYAPAGGEGGGPYDDSDVADEFYWAAAELYLTTGEQPFADRILASSQHTANVWRPLGFSWKDTAALGRLALATVPSDLPDRDRVRESVVSGADSYLKAAKGQAYGMPYAPPENRYDWGSNSEVLNNMVVLAVAYDITDGSRYRDAVVQGMDYILGRNALNTSFVTGYGERSTQNQHSRWYANQLDPKLPHPPHGSLAGGPNSSIQDPLAKVKLAGCVGQFCYLDDITSWSTNELTINWNAPLAWIAAFIADL